MSTNIEVNSSDQRKAANEYRSEYESKCHSLDGIIGVEWISVNIDWYLFSSGCEQSQSDSLNDVNEVVFFGFILRDTVERPWMVVKCEDEKQLVHICSRSILIRHVSELMAEGDSLQEVVDELREKHIQPVNIPRRRKTHWRSFLIVIFTRGNLNTLLNTYMNQKKNIFFLLWRFI